MLHLSASGIPVAAARAEAAICADKKSYRCAQTTDSQSGRRVPFILHPCPAGLLSIKPLKGERLDCANLLKHATTFGSFGISLVQTFKLYVLLLIRTLKVTMQNHNANIQTPLEVFDRVAEHCR